MLKFIKTTSNSKDVSGGLIAVKNNIFIPGVYNNPISYLKQGCPIWILQGDGITYDIYQLSKDTNEEELVEAVEEYIL